MARSGGMCQHQSTEESTDDGAVPTGEHGSTDYCGRNRQKDPIPECCRSGSNEPILIPSMIPAKPASTRAPRKAPRSCAS